MNADQKQMLRDALVAALVAAAPVSLPLATLRMAAKAAGFHLTDEELEANLDYVVKKDFAEITTAALSKAVRRWKSTAAAVDYCEENGLA